MIKIDKHLIDKKTKQKQKTRLSDKNGITNMSYIVLTKVL